MSTQTKYFHGEIRKVLPGHPSYLELWLTSDWFLSCFYISVSLYHLCTFFYLKISVFFLLFHKNIYWGYSLEWPQQGASNDYLQYVFMKIPQYPLIWSYVLLHIDLFLVLTSVQVCIAFAEASSFCLPFLSLFCKHSNWKKKKKKKKK